jgi:mannan endo-1,4-beta-mannosidase
MPITITFKIVSQTSGKVLDVLGGSLDDWAQIIQFQDNSGPTQRWQVFIPFERPPSGAGFVIRNAGSGKVLDVKGGLPCPILPQLSNFSSMAA